MPEIPELPKDAFAATELGAGVSLIEQDLIVKANAGAMLTFAVWSLPKDVVTALFKNAPAAFSTAYEAAFQAYGLGGGSKSREPVMRWDGPVLSKQAAEDLIVKALNRLQEQRARKQQAL